MSILDFAFTIACGLTLMLFALASFADAVKDHEKKRATQKARVRR
jgi:hypothetical protein